MGQDWLGGISQHEGDQWQATQGEARAIEEERTHVVHADALGDEGETPDKGGE
jgi:hypothetical protein